MDAYTLDIARTCGDCVTIDNLIALACGCKRQNKARTVAPLTDEDAAIVLNRAPRGLRIDEYGNYIAFGSGQDSALRFVLDLNR
jgi:hypothetical protein